MSQGPPANSVCQSHPEISFLFVAQIPLDAKKSPVFLSWSLNWVHDHLPSLFFYTFSYLLLPSVLFPNALRRRLPLRAILGTCLLKNQSNHRFGTC